MQTNLTLFLLVRRGIWRELPHRCLRRLTYYSLDDWQSDEACEELTFASLVRWSLVRWGTQVDEAMAAASTKTRARKLLLAAPQSASERRAETAGLSAKRKAKHSGREAEEAAREAALGGAKWVASQEQITRDLAGGGEGGGGGGGRRKKAAVVLEGGSAFDRGDGGGDEGGGGETRGGKEAGEGKVHNAGEFAFTDFDPNRVRLRKSKHKTKGNFKSKGRFKRRS